MTDPLAALRERHEPVLGNSMEPDPERPGYLRQTIWCPTCLPSTMEGSGMLTWPCDAERFRQAFDAANEDAERLAVLYEAMAEGWHRDNHDAMDTWTTCAHFLCQRRQAALAAHRARVAP